MSKVLVSSSSLTPGELLRGRTSHTVPAAWKAISDYYTEIASVIADADIDVSLGPSLVSKASSTSISLNASVLPVIPALLSKDNFSHMNALTVLHGSFLHELGHTLFTKWSPSLSLDPDRAEIISALEDLRVEYHLLKIRPQSRQWLRSHADAGLKDLTYRSLSANMRLLLSSLLTVGKAHMGVLSSKDVLSSIKIAEAAYTEKELEIFLDVLGSLKVVKDDDDKSMLSLTDKLYELLQKGSTSFDLDKRTASSEDAAKNSPGDEDSQDSSEKNASGRKTPKDAGKHQEELSADKSSKKSNKGDSSSDKDDPDADPDEAGFGKDGLTERNSSEDRSDKDGSGKGNSGKIDATDKSAQDELLGKSPRIDSLVQGSSDAPSSREDFMEGLSEKDLESLYKAAFEELKAASSKAVELVRGKRPEFIPAVDKDLPSLLLSLKEDVLKKDKKALPVLEKEASEELDLEEDLVDALGHHGSGFDFSPVVRKERDPLPKERILRTSLTRRLQQVQWRDRRLSVVNSTLPPGRLHPRELVRAKAETLSNKRVTARPWKSTKHTPVTTPLLRVGVLCDVSGSMASVAGAVSTSMWVTASSVHDTGGTAVGIAFGSRARVIIEKGYKAPEKVSSFTANASMEAIFDALVLADDRLDLYNKRTQGNSPRILVIISDGYWVDTNQNKRANLELARLQKEGVKIIHVGIGSLPVNHPGNVHTFLSKVTALDAVIGEACAKALQEA